MSRFRTVLVVAAGLILIASSVAHSLLGWPQLSMRLNTEHVPLDLIAGLAMGWHFAGVGAQVVDVIQRDAFDQLDAPVLRVTGADVPMPYNKRLEKLAKADADKVTDAVKKVLYR